MSETQHQPIDLSPEGFSKYLNGGREELVESTTIEQGTGWKLVQEEWHVFRFRIAADPDVEVAHATLDSPLQQGASSRAKVARTCRRDDSENSG